MAVKTYKKDSSEKLSENFRVYEFACHGSKCCSTVLIDEKLVAYLQQIRDHFGAAVTISSGYRCKTHNARVGGATASRHMSGQAADIKVQGVAPAEVAKYAESIGILGIGLYDSFVHIDTRTSKYFWYGSGEEYRATFGGTAIQEEKEPAAYVPISVELPVLKRGDTGDTVKALQILLIGAGYHCGRAGADGIYGSGTENAVEALQEDLDINDRDGIAGALEWRALLGL